MLLTSGVTNGSRAHAERREASRRPAVLSTATQAKKKQLQSNSKSVQSSAAVPAASLNVNDYGTPVFRRRSSPHQKHLHRKIWCSRSIPSLREVSTRPAPETSHSPPRASASSYRRHAILASACAAPAGVHASSAAFSSNSFRPRTSGTFCPATAARACPEAAERPLPWPRLASATKGTSFGADADAAAAATVMKSSAVVAATGPGVGLCCGVSGAGIALSAPKYVRHWYCGWLHGGACVRGSASAEEWRSSRY